MAIQVMNPHKHPFVRWNAGASTYEETFVYDQETGKKILVWPIDQKELLAQADGRFALTPPAPKPEPVVAPAAPGPTASKATDSKEK